MKKIKYNQREYVNPYFDAREKKVKAKATQKFKPIVINWKLLGILIIFVSSSVLLSWLLIWSSVFKIKSIEVSGINGIEKETIYNLANNKTFGNNLGIFPRNNIFIFSSKVIKDEMTGLYNFRNIEIHKNIPSKISIVVASRQQSAVWHEIDRYYFIDSSGAVVKEVNLSDIASSSILLIDNLSDKKIENNNVAVDPKSIETAIELNEEYKNPSHNLIVEKFMIDNELNTVKMKISAGPLIYFSTKNNISDQVTKLDILIKEKIKTDLANKTYIDMRYGETINFR